MSIISLGIVFKIIIPNKKIAWTAFALFQFFPVSIYLILCFKVLTNLEYHATESICLYILIPLGIFIFLWTLFRGHLRAKPKRWAKIGTYSTFFNIVIFYLLNYNVFSALADTWFIYLPGLLCLVLYFYVPAEIDVPLTAKERSRKRKLKKEAI